MEFSKDWQVKFMTAFIMHRAATSEKINGHGTAHAAYEAMTAMMLLINDHDDMVIEHEDNQT